MDRRAAVGAFEASVAALGAVVRGAGSADSCGAADADPLRQWADDCLDGLLRADIAATLLLGAAAGRISPTATVSGAGGGNINFTADHTTENRANGKAGRVPSPSAHVLVTVPVFALMGLTDEPAMLDGYGPIPASMARNLVADGASSFNRVLTDPRDGAPLEIGRGSYRISAAMRRWLRMRDGKCLFPGCSKTTPMAAPILGQLARHEPGRALPEDTLPDMGGSRDWAMPSPATRGPAPGRDVGWKTRARR